MNNGIEAKANKQLEQRSPAVRSCLLNRGVRPERVVASMEHKCRLASVIMPILLLLCPANRANGVVFYCVQGGASASSPARSGIYLPDVDWSTRVGLALGVKIDVSVTRQLSLLAEPMIVQRGMHVDWHDAEMNNTVKYTYLDLPINLAVRFHPPYVHPFLFGGPFGSVALTQKVVLDNGGYSSEVDDRRFDIGFALGGGVAVPVSAQLSLSCSGRYCVGLLDIAKTPYASTKNRAAVLLTGLEFH